jgi:hypothetical protein
MIRWLCNKIYRTGCRYEERSERGRDSIPLAIESSPDVCMDKALRFNLLPARGGSILEIRTHDTRTHEWDTVTHVIPEGADVAKAVGSIVAMELLRH